MKLLLISDPFCLHCFKET